MKKVKFFSEKDNLKQRVLTTEEELELFKLMPEYLKNIVLTAIHTGMRKSEVLKLKWEDVNLENREIKVTKTKNGRIKIIPINGLLCSMLLRLKSRNGDSRYLFNNEKTGQPFKDVKRSFKGACNKADIKELRFHDLRHTFASRLVEYGADLITVRDLMGHSSVRITERYTHTNTIMKTKAVDSLAQARKAEQKQENLAQIGHTEKKPHGAVCLFSVN